MKQKVLKYSIRPVLFMVLSMVLLTFCTVPTAFAYTATVYHTSQSFSVGTLIALNSNEQPIAAVNGNDCIGTVISQSKSGIEVAGSGVVPVFVSNPNGVIKSGDKIGLSSIAGVGVLWQTSETQIGVATESISSSSSKWQTVSATTHNGTIKENIKVAKMMVRLTSGSNTATSEITGTLQQAAAGLVGHSVALWQIVIAGLVGIGGLILAFGLVLSSGHESLSSLGRNPMASKVILKGMWRIVATSITVMLVGILLAYLVLKVGSA
jgi:hypothetical protein